MRRLTTPRQARWGAISALLVGLGSVVSCSGGRASVDLDGTDGLRLTSDMYSASQGDSTIRLADMTGFAWTTVSIFVLSTSADTVADVTGYDLGASEYVDAEYYLVFCDKGAVVAATGYNYGGVLSQGTRDTYDDEYALGGGAVSQATWHEVLPDCGQ